MGKLIKFPCSYEQTVDAVRDLADQVVCDLLQTHQQQQLDEQYLLLIERWNEIHAEGGDEGD